MSHPNILIRTDGSGDIGTGHLVRCLALADALAAAGAAVRFLCRTLPAALDAAIRERGHELRRLLAPASHGSAPSAGDPPHAHWLGCTWEEDASASLEAIALEALQRLGRPDLGVDVVVGALNPHLDEIAARCRSMSNVEVHPQTKDMPGLMARCDLALGAAGSVSWERCCLGLPAIAGWVASNQRQVACTLARHRAAVNLGDLNRLTAAELAASLERLAHRPRLLGRMSARAAGLVDGGGIARVCFALLRDAALSIDSAVASDAELAWKWRNAEVTRRQSFDPAPIPLAAHHVWWKQMIASTQHALIIRRVAGMPVGVLRFDMNAPVAQISIYLDPDMTGYGIGSALLRAALTWLKGQHRKPGAWRRSSSRTTSGRGARSWPQASSSSRCAWRGSTPLRSMRT